MSTVKEIETAIRQLSPAEVQQIQEFLDDLMEDQLEFTEEFEAQIKASESEMAAGRHSRVKHA